MAASVCFILATANLIAFAAANVWSIESCVSGCLQNFMVSTGEATFGKGKSLEHLSWQEILDLSNTDTDYKDMEKKFSTICQAYATLKTCLKNCPNTKLHDTIIHGFASLEYICNTRREEFLKYMPCLAKHEKTVMLQCRRETNQTLIATQILQRAAFQNNLQDFRHLLRHLCRNTTQIIDCMTPATERACGTRPAAMLRHLVALSFNNIENLYAHLGLHDQLPVECRELGKMSETDYDANEDFDGSTRVSAERTRYSNSAGKLKDADTYFKSLLLGLFLSVLFYVHLLS